MTDFTAAEVQQWQTRPLCCRYPVMAFDALRVRVAEHGGARDKTVHFALGMHPEGPNEILGLWIEDSAGEEFWFEVFTRLKERGVERIRVVVADEPQRLRPAIDAVFPATMLHASLMQSIRNSIRDTKPRDRTSVVDALRAICSASSAIAAKAALDAFAKGSWGAKYTSVVGYWQTSWDTMTPFFALPREVRRTVVRAIDTLEEMHARLRAPLRSRGSFTDDLSAAAFILRTQRDAMRRWQPWQIAASNND